MAAVLDRHADEIAELCRRYGLARLEVFGSAARGEDFEPARSDVDFLAAFADEAAVPPLEQVSASRASWRRSWAGRSIWSRPVR